MSSHDLAWPHVQIDWITIVVPPAARCSGKLQIFTQNLWCRSCTLHGCNFPNCRATLRAATIHISSGPCKWSISQDDKRVPLWRTHNLHPPGHLHVCLHQKSPKTKATVSLWKERTVWCSVQGSCDWNKAALGCVHCLCCHGFLHYIVATWDACVHCSLEKIVFCSV